MRSCNNVGSKVSTLLARQLMTSVALALPSSFVSSPTFTSGTRNGFDSECRTEWSQNLCSVCYSTFTFDGALLCLCTCLGVSSGLCILFLCGFLSTTCILHSWCQVYYSVRSQLHTFFCQFYESNCIK